MSIVIFSHGKESGPYGNKIRILKEVADTKGFETVSIDYTMCIDANERIAMLRDTVNKHTQPIILVGSSMGGYVSTVISCECSVSGMFLMCPALYMENEEYNFHNYEPKCYKIEVVHGWADEIVPYQNSIRFASVTKSVLNLIDDNHKLSNSYDFIKHRFEEFLKQF